MKNFADYTYFVYIGNNKSYGFYTYRHPQTGMPVGYVVGRDDKGNPVYKKWRFNNDSMRQIRVHAEEQDLNGLKAIDFLRNSPECLNSTNGHKIGNQQVLVYFKELNDSKDAADAIATRRISLDAQNAALALKGDDLVDFAAVIGIFNVNPDILSHRVLDYASNYPTKTLEYINDPSRKVKALVKKAINAKVFSEDGRQIKWEGKLIGADEDEAVSNLLKDEKLKKAIELNLSKFGG